MYNLIEQIKDKTVIEKSKFYSFSFNCSSYKEQTEILKIIKKEYFSATHICYASIIFDKGQMLCYSSDDREPSGTAGVQILQALKENEFVNTLCVVVRYFGGIKLGVPGLGRAYKESALCVLVNNKKLVNLKEEYIVHCDYTQYDNIKKYCEKNGILCQSVNFDKDVNFVAYFNQEEYDFVEKLALDITKTDNQTYC